MDYLISELTIYIYLVIKFSINYSKQEKTYSQHSTALVRRHFTFC